MPNVLFVIHCSILVALFAIHFPISFLIFSHGAGGGGGGRGGGGVDFNYGDMEWNKMQVSPGVQKMQTLQQLLDIIIMH